MSCNGNRSAPTSPGHQQPPPSSTANRTSQPQQQQPTSNQNRRGKSSNLFGNSHGSSGFDINQFSQNISNSLQDIFNSNIFHGEPLMDVRKMLYKSCNSCGTTFSVFFRKLFIFCPSSVVSQRRCQNCMLHFCHGCMEQSQRIHRCRRCLVFAEPLTKDSLSSLRVRDLKWFLSNRNIPSDTYSEKRELIDLILAHVNPPPSASRRSSSSSSAGSQAQFQPPSSRAASTAGDPPPRPSSQPSSPPPRAPQAPCSSSSSTTATPRHPNEPTHPSESTSSLNVKATSNLNISTFNLNDIKDEAEIKDLSVRQLKLLLARNFVDFKGCVERDELISKAVLLWNDKQISNKFKDEHDEVDGLDENTCKICMENAIDCVLLECGHMLTCTDCGKILSECPVCRQFVTRVVHVFKA